MIELLIVLFAGMTLVAMLLVLVPSYRQSGEFRNVAEGLIDLSSAIRKYGDAHRWFSGSTFEQSDDATAIYTDSRFGFLNFCGMKLAQDREDQLAGAFLLTKDELESHYLGEAFDNLWERGIRLESILYRNAAPPQQSGWWIPEPDPIVGGSIVVGSTAGVTLDPNFIPETRYPDFKTVADSGALHTNDPNFAKHVTQFMGYCSRNPTYDRIGIHLKSTSGNISTMGDLYDYLKEFLHEVESCGRLKLPDTKPSSDTMELEYVPNSSQKAVC